MHTILIRLRKFIFDERLFELHMEGFSFMDCKRRGIAYMRRIIDIHNNDADTKLNTNPNAGNGTNPDYPQSNLDADMTKSLLLPIPTIELNANLEIGYANQNPGY